MRNKLDEKEKQVLNRKLINDAVFTRKAHFTLKEINALKLSPEQRERAMVKNGYAITNWRGEVKS